MKVPFGSVFTVNADKSLNVVAAFRAGGVTFQAGAKLAVGQIVGGVDFTQYAGKELEVSIEDGTYVITGIY